MSQKPLAEVAKQRPSFMELLHLLPPYTVEDVIKSYQEQTQKLPPDEETAAAQHLQSAYERALDHARFQESRRAWLGGRMEVFQERQQLIAEIEVAGGMVVLQPSDPYIYEYGEDFAYVLRKLVAVHLTGPVTTDASLEWLQHGNAALGEIRLLDLSGAHVTTKGLEAIASLTGLRCLDLRGTDVSAKVVDSLAALNTLEWLHVGETSVGLLSRQRLKRSLPRLSIATDANEPAPPADGPEYEHMRLQRRLSDLGMLP
ncbi:MAG: hypothetical protein JNG89_00690 [Planctomycetaceae bacterium]|nr:hypothetical protein [Planctomycetaceae bacterium]